MRYLTTAELAAAIGCSARTVARYVQRGTLPQPLRLSPKIARWDSQQVAASIAKARKEKH